MKTSNIFRRPSFLKGVARTFDIFGTLDKYKYSEESDSQLLKSDWESVGRDLTQTVEKYAKKSYS